MAKKKARTTAQRRVAAKEAWKLRKLRDAGLVKPHKTPVPAVSFAPAQTPTTAVATQEGGEFYITISSGGSIFRHKFSRDTIRSLGLDCLKLAY